eukprot:TRINITY_DN6553_c0_g1_i2.p1 TRINITY_DN6553_c0_g1~~TRINITY_DN6553_c0_g1_i2.p1  ORF type:complete len:615 (-),score=101.90 TRINITY_DN6553_c0_g1_i2:48-1892(-)
MMALVVVLSLISVVMGASPLMEPYNQYSFSRYTLKNSPAMADWKSLPVSQIASLGTWRDQSFMLLGGSQLFLFTNGTFVDITRDYPGLQITNASKIVTWGTDSVAVVDPQNIYFCAHRGQKCGQLTVPLGSVNDIKHDASLNHVLVGSENALYVFSASAPFSYKRFDFGNVTAIATDQHGMIALSTPGLLWRTLQNGDYDSFHFWRTPGLVDDTPSSLAFDSKGDLWIANDVCINVLTLDLEFRRIAGNEGLPQANLTYVAVDNSYPNQETIWFGSVYGLIKYTPTLNSWKYFYGPSALPGSMTQGQTVYQVVPFSIPGSSLSYIAISTSGGLSIYSERKMTLLDKALEMDAYMQYFRSPVAGAHPYVGYLAGDIGLQSFGNLSSWVAQSSDNNGLWTSMYLAGECFRYSITKDPEVKKNAWKYFEGLEFLVNVTGIPGLMARSALYQNEFPQGGTWHHSKTYPGWIWKGDTSSDEVCGHLMVHPLVYRLLAETAEEKARAYRLIDNITRYIVENDFQLIDVTGKPTTWGRWDPYNLNQRVDWYIQRGLNSVQIISWLISAYATTEDPYFLQAYQELASRQNAYLINVVNPKIVDPQVCFLFLFFSCLVFIPTI